MSLLEQRKLEFLSYIERIKDFVNVSETGRNSLQIEFKINEEYREIEIYDTLIEGFFLSSRNGKNVSYFYKEYNTIEESAKDFLEEYDYYNNLGK